MAFSCALPLRAGVCMRWALLGAVLFFIGPLCVQAANSAPDVMIAAVSSGGNAGQERQTSKEDAWYISFPRVACLGDSIIASSFVQYYPESIEGDGKTLTITLPSAGHILKVGSKIKLTGYDKDICSKIFTVTLVNNKHISVESSFKGAAKKQSSFKAACNTFKIRQGYVGQALKYAPVTSPLFVAAFPAGSVGIVSRDTLKIMDYELMPFSDYFDVVIIQLGTNDMGSNKFTVEEYICNMSKIIDKVHGAGKKVIIGNLPPVLPLSHPSLQSPAAYSARIKEANKALVELGERHNVPVLDFYSELVAQDGYAKKEYMSDARHPNVKGYAIMGKILHAHAKKYFTSASHKGSE